MSINKLYLLTDDYCIVYIDHMCACDKCRERGETEIFTHGLDGSYADCLKLNELNMNFKECGILTCGNSIDDIVKWIKDFVVDKQNNEIKLYQTLNKLLNEKIYEKEKDDIAETENEKDCFYREFPRGTTFDAAINKLNNMNQDEREYYLWHLFKVKY